MLYNTKWDVQAKPDVYSLESLIAWLEKQPAEKVYCYYKSGECLFAQYFTAMGFKNVEMGGFELWHGLDRKMINLPHAFVYIPATCPYTFGAALDRARKALAA